jgi:hypothetical protein
MGMVSYFFLEQKSNLANMRGGGRKGAAFMRPRLPRVEWAWLGARQFTQPLTPRRRGVTAEPRAQLSKDTSGYPATYRVGGRSAQGQCAQYQVPGITALTHAQGAAQCYAQPRKGKRLCWDSRIKDLAEAAGGASAGSSAQTAAAALAKTAAWTAAEAAAEVAAEAAAEAAE